MGAGSVWLSELIWREFYRHLMTYYPSLCKHRPFIAWTDRVQWQSNPAHLQGLAERQNGIPELLMPLCVSLTALAGCITGYG
ncbi:deoxyribodipyrimidine photolyase, FAD-binding [Escherichia coli]|uniref:Deoxyribodipyrimidine photolyase, FAD-binding n=1 Tax=Escherichia coli TaxID=562 RepID=A0A376KZK1_ECOLX|nr:deoxyribodipyrimidine photolyase, FAD-binding [Escherichia coli]